MPTSQYYMMKQQMPKAYANALKTGTMGKGVGGVLPTPKSKKKFNPKKFKAAQKKVFSM